MYKYYYTLKTEDTIMSIGKAKKVPKNGIEITKEQYDSYKETLASIPDKDGYSKNVTLYIDGSFTVEYIKDEEIIVNEE